MINKKKICQCALTALVVCSAITGLTGCSKDEPKDTVNYLMCEGSPSIYSMNGFEFKLADDGKTIEELTYKAGFNKESLEKYWTDSTLDEAYNQAKSLNESTYINMVVNNADISWIKGGVFDKPENYETQMILVFDFTDETFDSKDKATREYLNTWRIYDMFYNEDEMRFEVSKDNLENYKFEDEMKFVCKEKTFEKGKTESTSSAKIDNLNQNEK